VKVAVLEGSPKGAALKRFAESTYDIGPDGIISPAMVIDALRKALSACKAPRNAASLAVPAETCIVREITVPFTQDDQIRKVVKFEFEPHLHNNAIEEVIVDSSGYALELRHEANCPACVQAAASTSARPSCRQARRTSGSGTAAASMLTPSCSVPS
jgi:Tfp pilus assembly PilM family ATPase